MSKGVVVENWKQHVGVGVTQSLDASIIITGVEMVVAPTMDFVKMGILFRFA